ncbi:AraC family transcriptional regulator, partial [Pseudomonas aeruginosa]|nr:AraC family transcriptional regulator [Pseudomonas aeruginosa]
MLLHAHPERTWSVDLLARKVNQSRSGFSQRFASVMGESTMRYLTRTRMHIAADFLETTGLRVSQIAKRVGYESEPAFSRRSVGRWERLLWIFVSKAQRPKFKSERSNKHFSNPPFGGFLIVRRF